MSFVSCNLNIMSKWLVTGSVVEKDIFNDDLEKQLHSYSSIVCMNQEAQENFYVKIK
jgi:hypothetical protein